MALLDVGWAFHVRAGARIIEGIFHFFFTVFDEKVESTALAAGFFLHLLFRFTAADNRNCCRFLGRPLEL